jgi:hypothetical protein
MALDQAAASAVWGEGVGSRRGKPRHGHALWSSPALAVAPKGTGAAAMAARRAPSQGRSAAATLAALGVAPEALDGGSLPGRAAQRRGTRSARDGPPARALGARRRLARPRGCCRRVRLGTPARSARPAEEQAARPARPPGYSGLGARGSPAQGGWRRLDRPQARRGWDYPGRRRFRLATPARTHARPQRGVGGWELLAPGDGQDSPWRRRLQGAVRVGNPSRPNIK